MTYARRMAKETATAAASLAPDRGYGQGHGRGSALEGQDPRATGVE